MVPRKLANKHLNKKKPHETPIQRAESRINDHVNSNRQPNRNIVSCLTVFSVCLVCIEHPTQHQPAFEFWQTKIAESIRQPAAHGNFFARFFRIQRNPWMCGERPVQTNAIVHTILAFYPPAINHNQWRKIISSEAQQELKRERARVQLNYKFSVREIDGDGEARNYYLANAQIERLNTATATARQTENDGRAKEKPNVRNSRNKWLFRGCVLIVPIVRHSLANAYRDHRTQTHARFPFHFLFRFQIVMALGNFPKL